MVMLMLEGEVIDAIACGHARREERCILYVAILCCAIGAAAF